MNCDQNKRTLSRAFERAEDARRRAFDTSPAQNGLSPRRTLKPKTASTSLNVGRVPLMHQRQRLFEGIRINSPTEEHPSHVMSPSNNNKKRVSGPSRAGIRLAILDRAIVGSNVTELDNPKSFS